MNKIAKSLISASAVLLAFQTQASVRRSMWVRRNIYRAAVLATAGIRTEK